MHPCAVGGNSYKHVRYLRSAVKLLAQVHTCSLAELALPLLQKVSTPIYCPVCLNSCAVAAVPGKTALPLTLRRHPDLG